MSSKRESALLPNETDVTEANPSSSPICLQLAPPVYGTGEGGELLRHERKYKRPLSRHTQFPLFIAILKSGGDIERHIYTLLFLRMVCG